MRIAAATFAASLLALSACGGVPTRTQITVIERQTLSAAQLGAPAGRPHRLQLHVVQVEGGGWTRERALGALGEAAAILAQCGVSLERVEWQRLAVPVRFLDFSTPVARELASLHPVPRPAVFLVRDTRSEPAFDAEAIGRGNSRSRPELADTVWITAAARDPGIVLAHELAHVLMDSGEHSEVPGNLMHAETSGTNTALSAAQCERLRATGSAHGLLRR